MKRSMKAHTSSLKPSMAQSSLIRILYGKEKPVSDGCRVIDIVEWITFMLCLGFAGFLFGRYWVYRTCRCGPRFVIDVILDFLCELCEELMQYVPPVDKTSTTIMFLSPLVLIRWRSTLVLFKWLLDGVIAMKCSALFYCVVIQAVSLFLEDVGLHPYYNVTSNKVLPIPQPLLYTSPITDAIPKFENFILFKA